MVYSWWMIERLNSSFIFTLNRHAQSSSPPVVELTPHREQACFETDRLMSASMFITKLRYRLLKIESGY